MCQIPHIEAKNSRVIIVGKSFFEKCIDFLDAECYHIYVVFTLLFFPMSISKSFFGLVGGLVVAQNAFADAAGVFNTNNYADGLKLGSSTSAATAFANIILALLGLITLVAVAYVLYAGFQILTAGGDEEKVKSGRKTIINVLIGIVVMWLAYWIVSLIMNALV